MTKTALLTLLLLGGCVSSRVVLDKTWNSSSMADFEDHYDFYALGLSGRNSIDLQRVCMERKPQAAEKLRTLEDGLLTLVTAGIYAPVTVRVWCD